MTETGISRSGKFKVPRVVISAVLLAILFAFYITIQPRGFSTYVMTIWSNQGLLLALAAIAQFFVVLVRGIDLSVGPMIALTNVAASHLLSGSLGEVALGVLLVMIVGTGCGLLNGLAVVVGRIPPIVATLALGSLYSGVALLLRPTPGGDIDETLSDALTYDVYGVPTALIALAIILVLVAIPLRRSRFGMSLYAIGSSRDASVMTGIRVPQVTLAAYALGGFFASLAGLYISMLTLTGDPNIGPSYTLNSIAAVVIGGVALSGGVGSPLGAALGAFILKTISALMFFSNLPPLAQPFFEGAILAIAIALGSLGMLRVRSRLERFL
ncbi:monosaccharide ABC transporter membrane protein, CUT2 family (TC 3.A.1.2.-) [Kaistia soli DSM 19436]|uniref:Monosaccharide ABC transporter membrane protein, CUT2 family (TC 3.A.1.2.-) n=1 Tax=Kaistia soli DSM 19436 TaxID=1122133 RepID=A0A1M5GBQ3_9HYPH|nr:ABC transporter permease [Kaistia soli]SHG01126.1 monosaccharide ABC transporter membrane protein, CUT2 family (TC 3.A.1.2.-) [Kaistia soli DSM 19436]